MLADVGPIWAQVCPCLGPRLWLLLLSWSSLFFVVVVGVGVGVVVVVVVVVALVFVVVVVGRCWPYLGAGLPLSWP